MGSCGAHRLLRARTPSAHAMSDDEDAKPSKVAAKPEKKINDDMGVIQKRAKDVEAFLARQQAKVSAAGDIGCGGSSGADSWSFRSNRRHSCALLMILPWAARTRRPRL